MVTPYDSIRVYVNHSTGELPLREAIAAVNDRFILAGHCCSQNLIDFRNACDHLIKIIDTYHAALVEIRDYNECPQDRQHSYRNGWADGSEHVSDIARKALEKHE